MIIVNIYTDSKTLKKSYSVETFHNNRYKNTGKMRENAFLSYFKMLKPRVYITKHVKNARDLESKLIQSLECKIVEN